MTISLTDPFMANGNIEAALAQFSAVTLDDYRSLFNAAGVTNFGPAVSSIGLLTPYEIDDAHAQYYFTTTVSNVSLLFFMNFENEYGVWKVKDF